MNTWGLLMCGIFLSILTGCFSQNIYVVRDLRAIQEVSVAKSFDRGWKFELGIKTTLEKNISRLGEFDVNAGISFKPIKFITLGSAYQWSENQKKNGDYIVRQRLSGDVDLDAKMDRFRFNYRICFQNIDDDLFQSEAKYPAKNVLRNRLQLKYKIRNCKIYPFVYAEHYGSLNHYENDYGLKIKIAAGTNWNINNRNSLKFYYRLDKELNVDHPYLFQNLCMSYKFEI